MQRGGDALHLRFVQIRVHGQAHHFGGQQVAHGQRGIGGDGGLFVERNRVVHGGGDACVFQGGLNGGAVWHAHGVLGIRTDVVRLDKRRGYARSGQFLRIHLRHFAAQADFFFEDGQFRQQNGGLQGVQTAVYAHADVVVAAVLAVPRDLADGGGEVFVIREHRAAVAVAAQRFAGEKAGAGDGGQVAGLAAFVARAETLRRVFDDGQAVFDGNGVNRVEIGALAVERHGNNRFGALCNRGFEFGGVEVAGVFAHIRIHGFCAQEGDGFGGGDVGEARGNHFVARAHAQSHQRDLQRVGAVGHADAVFRAAKGGEFFFQFGHFGPEDVLPVREHFLYARVDLVFNARLLGGEVDELHGVSLLWAFRRLLFYARGRLKVCKRCRCAGRRLGRCR